MTVFKFPLQRLLELREQREQVVARDLANARDAAELQRTQRDALASARDSAQAHVSQAAARSPTVGQLVSLSFAATQLGERADAADQQTVAADATVDVHRHALTAAAQERQILDRLRSRRLDEYRADIAQKERVTMDAIAISRHITAAPHEHKENKA